MRIYFKTPAELDKEIKEGGTKWADNPADLQAVKMGSKIVAAVKVNGLHEFLVFNVASELDAGKASYLATVAEKPTKAPNLVEGQAVDLPREAILKIVAG